MKIQLIIPHRKGNLPREKIFFKINNSETIEATIKSEADNVNETVVFLEIEEKNFKEKIIKEQNNHKVSLI